jgi:hypothetical protein
MTETLIKVASAASAREAAGAYSLVARDAPGGDFPSIREFVAGWRARDDAGRRD